MKEMKEMKENLFIGLDVGSTTVKAVVIDNKKNILWKDYKPHGTRQPEVVYQFLEDIERKFNDKNLLFFCTGSGAGTIAPKVGGRFVQEVNAISLAVKKLHPEVRAVIELGGQDAKIIIYKEDPKTKTLTTIPTMNDKCASGTGATIEKIAKKLGISLNDLCSKTYLPFINNLVHIAAKCGVFAETDVVGHLKAGLPDDQILASLFDSIVSQNLSVLTRGNTLKPKVLLLGGPNNFIKGMVEAWRYNIQKMWEERNISIPKGSSIEEMVVVPENALYYAAIGSVEFAMQDDEHIKEVKYPGKEKLKHYIDTERNESNNSDNNEGLWKDKEELNKFLKDYKQETFLPREFKSGEIVEGFLGIDGGSTSTKAVFVDKKGQVIQKSYMLSKGNPIKDVIDCVKEIKTYVEKFNASMKILGVGTTGYAKDVLGDVIGADSKLVETIAHTISAQQLYPKVDVICDVGGQDIKIIMLKNERVADFRLNTQCSAGNGYFLQSTASAFEVDIEDYANKAFNARKMPTFGYGCAVFMQSDIVNFQKDGWTSEEIMAGLANVLPKNIWLYVSKIPNLSSLGNTFVLQGGTQYNLSAVKAQIDFISERFRSKGEKVNIYVHKHCGEAGAIGCALEAIRLYEHGKSSTFIGIDQLISLKYKKTNNENTRCSFCKNKCSRTFIDIKINNGSEEIKYASKVPLEEGYSRIITGFSCEKGTVESIEEMKGIRDKMLGTMEDNPNLVEDMGREVFKPVVVEDAIPESNGIKDSLGFNLSYKKGLEKRRLNRSKIKIGVPRVLNMYNLNQFFMGYFQSLGIKHENIIFSPETNEKLYKDGAKRGSIDPCFPSKVCIPHVHHLIEKSKKNKLDAIFFPMIDSFPTFLKNVKASRTCPTVCSTPSSVKAAFTKESDIFQENDILYLSPLLRMDDPPLCEKQLYDSLKDILDLDEKENNIAVKTGYRSLEEFGERFRKIGKNIIKNLEKDRRLGFVVLARPYQNDTGLNHEILIRLQRLGYPIIAQEALPIDDETLNEVFFFDLKTSRVDDPREITDVWPTSYSENTSRKIWAAKFVARHPNLVALELSNFKCGHDSPPYLIIEKIISSSDTPFFTFRDLDENDPGSSIKMRTETIDYFLIREIEKLKIKNKENYIDGSKVSEPEETIAY